MSAYLEFKKANCKNCYKCLRECPVKAIEVINHQAKIIEERCILCGKCTHVCHQNAKLVNSEKDAVKNLLNSNTKVVASVAPSFVSSFGISDFSVFKIALGKLGFADAEETAVGANAVVEVYNEHLKSHKFENYITSACPSINRMIQLFYPKALSYLAPVDSPMVAHAKILKNKDTNTKVVFIAPCIAKKREAKESSVVDGVLTFEDLAEMFLEKDIMLNEIVNFNLDDEKLFKNKSKFFPINRGIIKSFIELEKDYEYVSVDGMERAMDVLSNIETLSGVFLEINACEFGCVNGPCSLLKAGSGIKATTDVRNYANKTFNAKGDFLQIQEGNYASFYKRMRSGSMVPTDREINDILAKTNKFSSSDELNCGACGYTTCREKAWAVINGYADVDMCLPYMRQRAESMSYEIIKNSPNGIAVVDYDLRIVEINAKAVEIFGIEDSFIKGKYLFDYYDPSEFLTVLSNKHQMKTKQVKILKTDKFAEMSINILPEHKILFCIMKDITNAVSYNDHLSKVKLETLQTTDEVIKKQMRVAQEIASLLGETTAETKIALLNLRKMLKEEGGNGSVS